MFGAYAFIVTELLHKERRMSKLPEWSDQDFTNKLKAGPAVIKFWAEW